MSGFLLGYLLASGSGRESGYRDGFRAGQAAGKPRCPSQQAFDGGETIYRCRLDEGHTGQHLGNLERGT